MAKLPYTFTICPDGPEPVKFTASCLQMGRLLKNSPDGNLTLDQKRRAVWDAWSGNHMGAIEEGLEAMAKRHEKEKNT